MKIVFVIRALVYGGAERQLVALARGLQAAGHEVSVVVFYPGGPLEPDVQETGIPLVSAGKRGRWDLFGFPWRLARLLRAQRPDIVHGYLGASNILSLLLKPVHGGKSVWGERASDMPLDHYDWPAKVDTFVENRLARFADLIIANSHVGRDHAVRRGFPAAKTIVIPNGTDTERFQLDPAGRKTVRDDWGVADGEWLIGRVGRIDPQKDYHSFLRAAAAVAAARPDVKFVCVGPGPEEQLEALRALARELKLVGRVIWAGARRDMPAVYSALDLAVSSSAYGEGTPNVVAEAMACGVPCVVTDVGDSAITAGSHGLVVPREAPEPLAAAMIALLDRVAAGEIDRDAIRAHVVQTLSLAALIDRTETALERVRSAPTRPVLPDTQELGAR